MMSSSAIRKPDRFFFNDTATTEIYTLSLHDALPICASCTPARLTEVGSNVAAAAPCGGRATRSRLYRMPNATTRITADSSDHSAPGWVRSLVHSDLITWAWVTCSVLISAPRRLNW